MHVGVCVCVCVCDIAGGADVYAGGMLSEGSLSTAHTLSYYHTSEGGSAS